MSGRQKGWLVYGLLLFAAFTFRAAVARFLPNDEPDDGRIYAQFARNLLEHHVYSPAADPPYSPSLIRLPGYPGFLAAVYAVFGHLDNTAVRIIQALIDTASCGLIALIVFHWEPDEKRKRPASIVALALAAICPFTTIYVATILTETITIFLAIAMCLAATLAFKSSTVERSMVLWFITGLIAGIAVLFRPDSGLFAAAIGITLVISILVGWDHVSRKEDIKPGKWTRLLRSFYVGGLFSLAFCLALSPWTIRNWRLFHVFQPLAPPHAEMPGEFVPHGYLRWLRTWLDDQRYIGPMLWSLDELPIKITDIPDRAFDSPQQKLRVATLLEKYNQKEDNLLQPGTEVNNQNALPTTSPPQISPSPQPLVTPSPEKPNPNQPDTSGGEESEESADAEEDTENDEAEEEEPAEETEAPPPGAVEMTPDIDQGFAAIARERISHAPLRYYLILPCKRAVYLWFDTHSQYYPFDGELLPLEDLDYDIQQHLWLPLFAGLTWIYTLLGVAGGWYLWSAGKFAARRWLLLAVLMIFIRLAFFSSIENPEPRYVVEIFPFLAIMGGTAVAQLFAFSKPAQRVET